MLEQALLTDMSGRPIAQDGPTSSRDWDEVQEFCRRVYMPYRVRPATPRLLPSATMRSVEVQRITMTRFSYGVPVHLDNFDPAAGNILVLNTIKGALRHKQDEVSDVSTGAGESFVVDCSRTDYWLDADSHHMQLNLTIPHQAMADVAMHWLGFVPDDTLWTRRLAFGGNGSRWYALLCYVVRSVEACGRLKAEPVMARHLEELLCLELLQTWGDGVGLAMRKETMPVTPRYVRQAEEIMSEQADNPPTIGEIARMVGVSARALSDGFRRSRGVTPYDFLRARRLEGLRKALQNPSLGETVTSIAADWGYVNLGALARIYRRRFGELPSHTLAAAKQT
ncbi:AraC family transcriptional regulator [Alcanivorax xiamenensis]|uniref:AraC family transcriptional regulator n=1 Tax=Alcanivorax xiamenensis TaxID=1177156 RepID=A0ABQ6YD26_9GAMM|nr:MULTISPECIES: helix-turn-helix transcriptional regulator [Alcanivorax]KAF0808137.1 AraC family transcriptional regulator [Alcanivorax xiamenensis]